MPRAPLSTLQAIGERVLSPAGLVSPVFRQGELLSQTEHRPWPVPEAPWVMRQTWLDLLFAHWRVPAEDLAKVVPTQLPLDTHSGSAWLGVTPFLVTGLRLRGTPPMPGASRFAEINVRTYVTVDGKPGIYFLSLDAATRSAVLAARRLYRLPYFKALMSHRCGDERVAFRSERQSTDGDAADFAASYRPLSDPSPPRPGTLEHFLTERYCLYTLDEDRRIHRGEIHHPPWPLQTAGAEMLENTMAAPFGIALKADPLLHYSARQDVLLWPIEPA
jgi:uncharacterized protein YqjF (DUF2071 family)